MTDKERLENMSPIGFDLNGNVLLKGEDYHWLMEQAKRVEELEEQNQRYREALEFYADRNNYKLEHFDPNLNDYMSTVDYDEGQKARQALEGEA